MDKIKALAERLENALTKLEINQSDASELSDAQAKLDEIQKELDAERANSKEITSKISDLEVDLEKAAAASADAALLTENHGTLEKRIEELEAEISLKDKALAAANGGGSTQKLFFALLTDNIKIPTTDFNCDLAHLIPPPAA